MISSTAVAAATPQLGLLSKISAFVTTSREAAADGITWAEFGDLMLALLRLVVSGLDKVQSMTGPEKKTLALDAVGNLFDAVADRAVPVAVYPLWLIARPAVRALVLALASGAVEQVLPLLRAA